LPVTPLSFLDHHIKVGNSLIGVPLGATVARNRAAVEAARKDLADGIARLETDVRRLSVFDPKSKVLAKEIRELRATPADTVYDSWTDAIPDTAFKPTTGDDRDVARRVMAANKRQRRTGQLTLTTMLVEMPADLVVLFDQLGAGAEDSVAEVTIRAETYEGIQRHAEYRHLLQQANVWTAAWFWPLRSEEPAPPTQELFATLATGHGSPPAPIAERVETEAETRRFFHFELEFPDVFTAERGGFDVVVGNPPYFGGMKIGVTFGENTYQFLKGTTTEVATGGRIDLAAYFVRRGFDLIRDGGELCFITTNTIGQGDTRDASLVPITSTWGVSIQTRAGFMAVRQLGAASTACP
jgi:hypothetical protein